MLKYIICFGAIFVSAYGVGELVIVHSPQSISFKDHEELHQSELKGVLLASQGFTVRKESQWSGLTVTDPFHYAEAVVCLVVDGVKTSGKSVRGHRFPLNTDEDELETWLALERQAKERFPEQNTTLMRMDLEDGSEAALPFYNLLGEISAKPTGFSLKALDLTVEEDYEFLKELQVLKEVVEKVSSGIAVRDGIPDLFWFVLPGLHAVRDFHGEDSRQAQEAQNLLGDVITAMGDAFATAYNGRAIVTVLTSDVSHTRVARSLKAVDGTEEGPDMAALNLAKDYDPDYPVMFNILLWFMVGFVFAIIAIAAAIGNMDPGRDSIIYRMTSTRMKKDN